jgi:hypothetical protein
MTRTRDTDMVYVQGVGGLKPPFSQSELTQDSDWRRAWCETSTVTGRIASTGISL